MRTLLVNENIFGSVSHEETFWSTLGRLLPDTQTLALSEFNGDLTARLEELKPDLVISNSILGALPLPDGTKSIVLLQDDFRAMERLLPVTWKTIIKRILRIPTFYKDSIRKQYEAIGAADRCVAVSNQVASSYQVPADIIPIGINPELFRPLGNKAELRQKYNIPEGEVAIFVGSSHPVKGFDQLYSEIIADPNRTYILVLKDEPGQFETPKNVRLFFRVNQEVLCELYNCADRYVGRSIVETLWLAPLEALFCNLPIDVTPVGIFNEWQPENKNPRQEALQAGLDQATMIRSWLKLLTLL